VAGLHQEGQCLRKGFVPSHLWMDTVQVVLVRHSVVGALVLFVSTALL
jgi:hypothetical protein